MADFEVVGDRAEFRKRMLRHGLWERVSSEIRRDEKEMVDSGVDVGVASVEAWKRAMAKWTDPYIRGLLGDGDVLGLDGVKPLVDSSGRPLPESVGYTEEVRWVMAHIDDGSVRVDQAPSKAAWQWLQEVRSSPKSRQDFYRVHVAKLAPKKDASAEDAQRWVDDGKPLELIEQLLEDDSVGCELAAGEVRGELVTPILLKHQVTGERFRLEAGAMVTVRADDFKLWEPVKADDGLSLEPEPSRGVIEG